MALSVVMPALEMAQETGKLVSWMKKEGEQVRKGEMLLEVETDKAVVEIEAVGDGLLSGITAQVGDVVPVGQTIAWLLQPGESLPTASHAPTVTGRRTDAAPVATASMGEAVGPRGGGARVSPKARRLAQDHGVDLATVRGSGPGGEILADDILAAASAETRTLKHALYKDADTRTLKRALYEEMPDTTTGETVRLKPDTATDVATNADAVSGSNRTSDSDGAFGSSRPSDSDGASGSSRPSDSAVVSGFSRTDTPAAKTLSSVARLMAQRTTQSWTSVPHLFLTRDADASALDAAREASLPILEKSHGVRVTHTDLLVAAVGRALRKHPRMNASWTADSIVQHPDVDVAIAMSVDQGVVTAVVRGADTAGLGEIAVRRRELAERARAGRLQPADISGATFTISNLGMFDVDAFSAIIVPPQAGILAVGAIADRVVAVGGQAAVRPMLTLTLSSDHRVIDGAGAARFLKDVVAAISDACAL
jgi:pyruvate dehydrogenase E2 component (dihydrolipoamide acetyltransferase)